MIYRSPYPDIEIPDTALTPFVFRRAAELANKTALVCGATGQSYTYAGLYDAVLRAAAGLHARGVRQREVVAIISPNVPDFSVAFHAVATLGAVNSTINPVSTAGEIAKQLADSRAVMIFTVPQLVEKCAEAAQGTHVREIITFGEAAGATDFATLLTHGTDVPHVDIDPARDLVALPYSSGTSGTPKGVMLTHRNLVANLCQMTGAASIIEERDILMGVLPFFHIYGMTVILNGALVQGATTVTLPKFELDLFLATIQKYRITYANLVPPIVLALAKHPAVANYDLSSLHTVFSGAAPLGEELAGAAATRLKLRIRQGYGLTETSPVTHFHPMDNDVIKLSSVGPAVPNTDCRIVDPVSGVDVGRGERGELWIRGPQVMLGYFHRPDATAACMTDDGWFKTGDVAVVDEQGWFYIVDRVKELIKYKGMQVAPAELEAVLLAHPAIADAAVIPVEDEEAGEIPKAFVVMRGEATPEEIMAFVAARVAPYKKVRRVEVVQQIPKSASGKILRRVLVEQERAKTTAS